MALIHIWHIYNVIEETFMTPLVTTQDRKVKFAKLAKYLLPSALPSRLLSFGGGLVCP